jgi:1-acyl-sn-glycerol-3-phosphate acyltransferase
MRWKVEGEVPSLPKAVAIFAPHSSNWDFVVTFAANWMLSLGVFWLAKDSLFRPPWGKILRKMGGFPVNRSQRNNHVEKLSQEFEKRDRMWLTIAPEGTRKPVERWRSGFYHIARQAQVPIILVALDWKRRRLRFGPVVEAIEKEEQAVAADIERIRGLFRGVSGKYRGV